MTATQGFTPDDRLFCIEHLTPEARKRLGWRWDEEDGVCEACWWNTKRGIFTSQCTYLDDAAILAEVVIWLYTHGELPEYDVEEAKWVCVAMPEGDEHFFDSLFTAAAFRKCKGGE